jgi:squalene-associated FAD-dependent desaturase
MQSGTVHVIGAGVAGLSAAVRLAGRGHHVIVHEQARQAGGRCRSYFDAAVGLTIDNGNHLVLSGNHAVRGLLATIGSENVLEGPASAEFPFVDLKSGERWSVRPNDGFFPWWILSRARRVPGSKAHEYLRLAPLLWAGPRTRIADAIACRGTLYERLWRPFLLAALNIEPADGSARLAGAVLRETLAKGGEACRPLIATEGLSSAFVEPARKYVEEHGGSVLLDRRLRALETGGGRVAGLDFGESKIALAPEDAVILAVPARVAGMLLPEISAPSEFNAIVNAHFRVAPPPGAPLMLGVVNGLIEWLFAFPDRLSVTISGADRLIDAPRESLAAEIWAEVAKIVGLGPEMPPWQIVKERRATFSATPEQDNRRPAAATQWSNLVLAGDWTQTSLPATLEGAVRSGNRAAELIAARNAVAAASGTRG